MDCLYRSSSISAPDIPEEILCKLIRLCVCNNTFLFDGKVYEQFDGVAMRSSLGPILANIWMAHLEEQHIVHSTLYPDYYRRYVDDTFCLFTDPSHAHDFLVFLNGIDDSTKFDIELESD